MSENEYSDTVRIRFGNSRTGGLEGCGGEILPPATLANTSWRIIDVDGGLIGGDPLLLQFEDGRLTARVACNTFSGAYTQRGHVLTGGPIASTRMACPGDETGREAKLAQLLQGPTRISYHSGLLLRLQREDESGTYLYLEALRN